MLSDLLDSRKDVASLAELQKLSKTYAIDPSLLQTLARVVNSPSIGERTTVRSVEDGEEKVRSKVSSPMLPSLAAFTGLTSKSGIVGQPADLMYALVTAFIWRLSTWNDIIPS